MIHSESEEASALLHAQVWCESKAEVPFSHSNTLHL